MRQTRTYIQCRYEQCWLKIKLPFEFRKQWTSTPLFFCNEVCNITHWTSRITTKVMQKTISKPEIPSKIEKSLFAQHMQYGPLQIHSNHFFAIYKAIKVKTMQMAGWLRIIIIYWICKWMQIPTGVALLLMRQATTLYIQIIHTFCEKSFPDVESWIDCFMFIWKKFKKIQFIICHEWNPYLTTHLRTSYY